MTSSDIIKKALEDLKKEIIENSRRAGQRATGKTEKMFEVRNVSDKGGELWGASWTGALESGRGVRKSTTQSNFKANLAEWIKAKGIPYKDEKDLQRLARFFEWRINRDGTKLYKSGGRKDIFTPPIEKAIKTITEEISKAYIVKIKQSIYGNT